MVQRLAEKYVGELSEMAKHSNLVTSPTDPGPDPDPDPDHDPDHRP